MGLLSKPAIGNAVTPPQRLGGDSTPQLSPFVLSSTAVESNLKVSKFWSDNWKTQHANLVQYFWKAFWAMSSLGLHRALHGRWALKAKHKLERLHDQEHTALDTAAVLFNRIRWIKTVKMMMAAWRSIWVCSALILPLSVTLLQIDGVITHTFGRTSALMSIIFSCAGLLSSGIYISGKLDFKHKRMERKWREASMKPEITRSIEFWASIALPMSSLLWSSLCFISTIVTIAWIQSNGTGTSAIESKATFLISATTLTSLILICIIQFLRAMMILTRV